MTRPRKFGAALVAVLAAGIVAGAAPARRPNILWLVGENLTHDLGSYGANNVHTPNLDAPAAQGVRFTRVFATNPTCAPSRSAFFTGMYQTTTDTHHMRSHRDDDFRLPPGVRLVTHWLRDAGYFTASLKTIGGRAVGTGKLDLNFVNEGPLYHAGADDWSALSGKQPFFAVINSHEIEYDIYDRQSAKKERVKWAGEDEHEKHDARLVRHFRVVSELNLKRGQGSDRKKCPRCRGGGTADGVSSMDETLIPLRLIASGVKLAPICLPRRLASRSAVPRIPPLRNPN